MLTQKLRRNPGRVRAVFYAVLVHAVVIGLIVIGFRWTSQPTSDQNVIQAVAVPQTPPKKPEAPKQPTPDEEQARQQAEAEKRQQAEQKRQQKQQEEQQQLEIARQKKAAQEKAQKLKEQEQKRAAEAARQQEQMRQQKREQKQAEQSLQQQLAAEEKARQDAAHAARAAGVVDQYTALIRQRVSHSWSRPPGSAKGLKCVVRVRLTPNGEVLGATVVQSSGNPVFDRSAENAVYKAAPLPLPDDPTLFDNFFRDFNFLFNPETQ